MDLSIIAGPNSEGKTTFAFGFLSNYADWKNFVNADLIAQGMAPFSLKTDVSSRVPYGLSLTLLRATSKGLIHPLVNRSAWIRCVAMSYSLQSLRM